MGVLKQSGNESVTLRYNIWFPCWKKKPACQGPECNQGALCCNGWYDSDFPIFHSYSQADEKETRKLPQPTPTHPLPPLLTSMWPQPIHFFLGSHISAEWEGEEVLSLKFNAEHLLHHQQNEGCKGANWLAPRTGGKSFYIMLIAHPPQLPLRANYKTLTARLTFLSLNIQYVPQWCRDSRAKMKLATKSDS